MKYIFVALLLASCAPIVRKPTETIEDFCGDYAIMRWRPSDDPMNQRRTFGWWYKECLTRETFREE